MKKFLTMIAFIGMFVLGACSAGIASAEKTKILNVFYDGREGCAGFYILTDSDTGVNYIVVANTTQSGGMSITARLNPDGSLYVTE